MGGQNVAVFIWKHCRVNGAQVQQGENTNKVLYHSVISIFKNIDETFFRKQQQIPDQKILETPYGGRLVIIMPQGNNIVVHFKDKECIRHKKRWSQVGK